MLLSRNFLHIGQVEIFLPANDTVICPTKDNQIGIEADTISHSRKLLLQFRVDVVDKMGEFAIFEALVLSQFI
ncbi:Uncharacterised protein [Streptococcus pneumoniae]|nr:Uncharacterised protein [Streptococcus pneumoniae]